MDAKEASSPVSEDECLKAIAALQEKALSIESEKNLAEANEFLHQNQKQKGIVSLENGKLQYQVIKPGFGNAVQRYNSPLMRYKGSISEWPGFWLFRRRRSGYTR